MRGSTTCQGGCCVLDVSRNALIDSLLEQLQRSMEGTLENSVSTGIVSAEMILLARSVRSAMRTMSLIESVDATSHMMIGSVFDVTSSLNDVYTMHRVYL